MPIVRIRYRVKYIAGQLRAIFEDGISCTLKGKEYRFVKDEFIEDNCGWHLYSENTLEEGFLEQIAPQLEELSKLEKYLKQLCLL